MLAMDGAAFVVAGEAENPSSEFAVARYVS